MSYAPATLPTREWTWLVFTPVQESNHWPFAKALSLSDDQWVDFLAHARVAESLVAPALPGDEVQRAWVGSSGLDALREAGRFYTRALRLLTDRGVPAQEIGRVLDFGCGWGRIYRLFLRNCRPGDLVGVDIDDGCIDICSSSMPYGNFERCDPMPPLGFGDGSFDVVTAYSVFSHLAEDPLRAWLREFGRLLRPGGIVFLTTLKEAHVDSWNARRNEDAHGAALATAGFNHESWRRRAAFGHVLFVPTGGGGSREAPAFYGETIVPHAYFEREAGGLGFEMLDYSHGDDLPQAFVALATPANAAARW